VLWYLAPSVIGDAEARAAVAGGPRPLAAAHRLRIAELERVEEDLLVVLYPA
jgi:riboflavin biosynthesis pyrimidine reductase